MSFIDIFTWIVLLIMIASLVGVFVFMGLWPPLVKQVKSPKNSVKKLRYWNHVLPNSNRVREVVNDFSPTVGLFGPVTTGD